MATPYWQKLRDPRWQKKRLEVMDAANFSCRACGDKTKTLNVHHKKYRKGAEPWEYENHELMCLCEDCHEENHGYRKAIDDELNTCEIMELPWIHALIVGYRGGIVAGEGVPSDQVNKLLFEECEEPYRTGLFADTLRNLSEPEVKALEDLFNMLNPDGFSDWVKRSIAAFQKGK